MTKLCERLIAEYLGWLTQGLRVNELEACCRISTPFLDRHNDEIEIYVEKRNSGIVLTDDGYTIADLEATGMSFEIDAGNLTRSFRLERRGRMIRVAFRAGR